VSAWELPPRGSDGLQTYADVVELHGDKLNLRAREIVVAIACCLGLRWQRCYLELDGGEDELK